jgi:hypothetical protein
MLAMTFGEGVLDFYGNLSLKGKLGIYILDSADINNLTKPVVIPELSTTFPLS